MAAKVPGLASCVIASACATSKPAQAPSARPPAQAPVAATAPALSTPARSLPPPPAPLTASPRPTHASQDHTPPQIVSARLHARGVRLEFSEPLAPVDDIDPSSFRLSVAGGEFDDGDAYAYHVDIAEIAGLDAPLRTVNLALDEGGRALQLSFSEKLPTELCELLEEEIADAADSPGAEFGVFVHYAPAEHGRIFDRSGNALAGQGAQWVTTRADTMEVAFASAVDGGLFGHLTRVHCQPDDRARALAWSGVPHIGEGPSS